MLHIINLVINQERGNDKIVTMTNRTYCIALKLLTECLLCNKFSVVSFYLLMSTRVRGNWYIASQKYTSLIISHRITVMQTCVDSNKKSLVVYNEPVSSSLKPSLNIPVSMFNGWSSSGQNLINSCWKKWKCLSLVLKTGITKTEILWSLEYLKWLIVTFSLLNWINCQLSSLEMGKVIISQINPNHYFCANDHCAKISEESVN